MDYSELVNRCETNIREGRGPDCARLLATLSASEVPREWRLRIANLCRRAGLISLGLKVLSHIIDPSCGPVAHPARDAELAEYSMLLMRATAYAESLATLDRVDSRKVPEANLYRAFAHFSRREFDAAITSLESYLATPLEPYQRLVGQVNFGFALVSSLRYDQALPLINEAMEIARSGSHFRLESNCHALLAQASVQRGAYANAIEHSEKALVLSGKRETSDGVFILKWLHFAKALGERNPEVLLDFKKIALESRDWDGIREAEMYGLKIEFDDERFHRLLAGTPFPSFRILITSTLGRQPSRSEVILGAANGPMLDLAEGSVNGEKVFEPGRVCHRVLQALFRDQYRPLKVGGLFSSLFPGERFDPYTSADRIHQTIRRTRDRLADAELSLELLESKGTYRPAIGPRLGVRVSLERDVENVMEVNFKALASALGRREEFTATEAREALGVSKATAHRILRWGIESGRLRRIGETTRSHTYKRVA